MPRSRVIHSTILLVLVVLVLTIATNTQDGFRTPPQLSAASAASTRQAASLFAPVISLASSTALPETLVAAFAGDPVLLYSLNGGISWQSVHTMPWGNAALSVAIAPRSEVGAPTRLLVAASGFDQSMVGVYRTGDFGQAWTKMSFPHPGSCNEPDQLGLVASPADPGRLYLAKVCWYDDGEISVAFSGVYTSGDAGVTWEAIKPDSDTLWLGVTPSPLIGSRVYIMDNKGRWSQSDDAGLTWTPKIFPILSLVLDAQDPNRLYSMGVRSINGGISWSAWLEQPCATSTDRPQLRAHPTETNVLFLRCGTGLYRSDDGGDHWTRLSSWVGQWLGPNYGQLGQVLWARQDGLRATNDQGATWTKVSDSYNLNLWPWQNISTPDSLGQVQMKALTPLSSTNVWAVGEHGTILNWNGSEWISVPSPVGTTLYSSAFASPDMGWAVGEQAILRWDGNIWTRVLSPTAVLRSVDSVSADDAWAVGERGTILHWDGAHWSAAISSTATVTTYLTAIDMISATEGWAVGGAMVDQDFDLYSPVILRWNGTSWSSVGVTAHAYSLVLKSVDMVSETDGWIAGGGTLWADTGTVLRWNGQRWQEILYALPSEPCSVSMASTGEGWIGKMDGNLLYWDGNVWTEKDLPPSEVGHWDMFSCSTQVAALPSGEVWTVREGGRAFYQKIPPFNFFVPWVQK